MAKSVQAFLGVLAPKPSEKFLVRNSSTYFFGMSPTSKDRSFTAFAPVKSVKWLLQRLKGVAKFGGLVVLRFCCVCEMLKESPRFS